MAAITPALPGEIRHDRSLEREAARRAASSLGDFRGTIRPGAQDALHSPQSGGSPRLGFPIIEEKPDDSKSKLPPIVMMIRRAD